MSTIYGIELLECPESPTGIHKFKSYGRYIPDENNFTAWMCTFCHKTYDLDTLITIYPEFINGL